MTTFLSLIFNLGRSQLFLSIVAIFITHISFVIFHNNSFPIYYYVVVFMSVWLVYNLYVFFLKEKDLGYLVLTKKKWAVHNVFWIKWVMVILSILLLLFTTKLPYNLFIHLIPLAIISLLYTIPFYKNFALRKIPIIKNVLVAIVWTDVTLVIPFLWNNNWNYLAMNKLLVGLFLIRFIQSYSMALIADVKDIPNDIIIGTKTIPNKSGIITTKIIVLILFMILSIVLFFISLKLMFISILLTIVWFVILQFVNRDTKDLFYIFCVDGLLVVESVLIYLILNENVYL